ncbi:MAG: DUF134 domain-containing protein [Clostridia bacterium]|nr:DUF134 domain-containing protein [Clostridia bacterium]
MQAERAQTGHTQAEEISRRVELAWLLGFYGPMLTEKQHEAVSLHCEEDMSLGEIAQSMAVSRQAVHEMIARAWEKMAAAEEKLHLAERFRVTEEGLIRCREALHRGDLREAETLLDRLIQQEQDQEEKHGL